MSEEIFCIRVVKHGPDVFETECRMPYPAKMGLVTWIKFSTALATGILRTKGLRIFLVGLIELLDEIPGVNVIDLNHEENNNNKTGQD